MTDIVEWLRGEVPHCDEFSNYDEWELRVLEAADEIERLRGVVLTAALMLSEIGLDPREKIEMAYEYLNELLAALGEGK